MKPSPLLGVTLAPGCGVAHDDGREPAGITTPGTDTGLAVDPDTGEPPVDPGCDAPFS